MLEIVRGLGGDVPRVAAVRLAGYRVLDVADQHQRWRHSERIEKRRLRLRHHEHVAFVNALPAADAGAVETEPLFEHAFIELANGNGEVLPGSEQIAEAQINGPDFFFTTQSEYFARTHCGRP